MSKTFQFYMNKNYPIDEELAFSLIFEERSLDLVSRSLEEKQ